MWLGNSNSNSFFGKIPLKTAALKCQVLIKSLMNESRLSSDL